MWLSSVEWVWRTLLKYQNESYEKAVFSDKTSGHFIWFNLVITCVLLEFPNWVLEVQMLISFNTFSQCMLVLNNNFISKSWYSI